MRRKTMCLSCFATVANMQRVSGSIGDKRNNLRRHLARTANNSNKSYWMMMATKSFSNNRRRKKLMLPDSDAKGSMTPSSSGLINIAAWQPRSSVSPHEFCNISRHYTKHSSIRQGTAGV